MARIHQGPQPLMVQCDPRKMPTPGQPVRATIRGADHTAADIFSLVELGQEHREAFQSQLPSDSHKRFAAELAWSFASARATIVARIEGEQRPLVRAAGLQELFSFPADGNQKDPHYPDLAREALMLEQPLSIWRPHADSVWNALEEAGGWEANEAFLDRLREEEPALTSMVLHYGLAQAYAKADREMIARLERVLQDPGLPENRAWASAFIDRGPNRRILLQQLPTFEYPSLDGNRLVGTRDLEGKVLYLDFWATWCKPCVEEMPDLHELHKTWGGKGLQIVSISVDHDSEDVRRFRKNRYPMPWINLLASRSRVINDFGVTTYPAGYLVFSDGLVFYGPVSPKAAAELVPQLLEFAADMPGAK